MEGELCFEDSSIIFAGWQIPYNKIKSAVLRTEYTFTKPTHTLLISDDFANYLFYIPKDYASMELPFSFQREVFDSWWNRYGLVVFIFVFLVIQTILFLI